MEKLTQKQIYNICVKLVDNIPQVLNTFKIDYIEYPNRFSFPCPVHGGDNPEGCSLFVDGASAKGNWRCWTHNCQEEYTSNIFGFVRGTISFTRQKKISLNETLSFCENILGAKLSECELQATRNNLDILDVFTKKPQNISTELSRSQVRSKLEIPCKYFINRGFLPETLDIFDVGLCKEKYKPMSGRSIVPIYDDSYKYVGCAGRALNNDLQPKWLYSKGFKKAVLYGMNLAKNDILKTGNIILVEGQGDVWKMHEAGYKQTVGIFGSSISDDQLLLLENSGACNVIILTDSDDAGDMAYKQIVKKCGRRFNYYRPRISAKDAGEMRVSDLQTELAQQLKGVIDAN